MPQRNAPGIRHGLAVGTPLSVVEGRRLAAVEADEYADWFVHPASRCLHWLRPAPSGAKLGRYYATGGTRSGAAATQRAAVAVIMHALREPLPPMPCVADAILFSDLPVKTIQARQERE